MDRQATGNQSPREDMEPCCYRFFKVTDNLYTFSLIFHLLLIPLMFALGANKVALYNVVSVFISALCIALNRRNWCSQAFFLFFLEINVHVYIATYELGWESGFYHYILLLAPLTFLNTRWSLRLKIFSSLILTVSFSTLFNTYHEKMYGEILIEPQFGHYLLYFNTITTVILYSAIGYYYSKAAHDNELKLRTAHREADWLAHTDPLTHIANRRAMTEIIEKETSRARRQKSSFVIALGDIDNFKNLNDSHSHEYGDSVLVHVASLIEQNIREHDQVARWGGEEFLILLPDTGAGDGMKLIERLRELIASMKHKYKGRDYDGVTMTFGLCLFDNSSNINDCIHHADQAMYRGKQQGKNRTVCSDEIDIYTEASTQLAG